ncbi:MAG: gamma-glutamyltransferase [Candidatus Bathyarchaeota archaeon]|nr:MAG: gamma-glutamyltransferase [Candidatus Bathyarchaeota archaeon]
MAIEGSRVVYEGKIATTIINWIQNRGGLMTEDDLAKYEPQMGKPMVIPFREYSVMTVPASIGGQTVLEILNILEKFDLSDIQHNSVQYLHLFIQCARHAFADRYHYLGDWEVAPVPI